jgi:hypothetical protein
MATSSSIKPIRKRRLNSPNDHIMVFVKELYNDAKANGLQTIHCYKKVLDLIKGYIIYLQIF